MKTFSIQTYLFILVTAISIPLISVVGFRIHNDMQQTVAYTKSSLRNLALMMRNNTETRIDEAHQVLRGIAGRDLVQKIDPQQCDPALSALKSIQPYYANILIADLNGMIVCSMFKTPTMFIAPNSKLENKLQNKLESKLQNKLQNVSDMPWFKTVMQQKKFTIGTPDLGPFSNKKVSVLSLPILDGKQKMVGSIHLPLELDAYDPHIPTDTLPDQSRYGFFADNGIMIWRNLDPENIIGTRLNADAAQRIVQLRDGEFESLAVDGVSRFFSVVPMPKVGWVAFVGVPADTVFARAKRHAITETVFSLGVIGTLWLLAILMARRISKPLIALATTAQAIRDGNLTVRASVVGVSEVAIVAQELNHMFEAQQANEMQLKTLLAQSQDAWQRVSDSEARYERAISGANDGIWEWNIVTNEEYLAPRYKHLLGFQDHELPNIRSSFIEQIHPEDLARVMAAIQEHIEHRAPYDIEMRLRCKNGEYRWFNSRGQAIWDEQGRPLCLAGSISDITQRKLAEDDLRIAAIAFESQEGMTVTDIHGTILRVNRAFMQITGYSAEEVIGQNTRLLRSDRHNNEFFVSMWNTINYTGSWEGEIWNRRKNGEVYPEYLIITAVKNQHQIITNYVATFNDITATKAAADEIANLAFYDPLTRLPNRRLLLDRLKQGLAFSARNVSEGGLLFIDLDNFKTLNDTHGHHMGDLLLQQVALRLSVAVRDTDTVARLGGDEFVVMLENLSADPLEAAAQAEVVGKKILATLNRPFLLEQHEHRCSASIGATLFNDHDTAINDLLQQADIAMYQAKTAGRNTLCFFDPAMQASIAARSAMESELHKVLGSDALCLYYQLQFNSENRPIGAEVLLRWIHPEYGLISPAQFIPIAEETGLILPIGEWVLETACAQLKLWEQDHLTQGLTLAVNVSAKQFRQANFVAQVLATVDSAGINPLRLKLEITESILLEKIENTITTINSLKESGIQFALDDFGTGYSSLQYLKKLPLNQLKIDQSFVRDLSSNNSDKVIVRTIIAMAHSLNLEVIAEGVETLEQREILTQNGCTRYQGYYFGKPVPIEQFMVLLQEIAAKSSVSQ